MSRLKPGSQLGPFPYRIVRQLGANSGNMSDIYLATVGDPSAQGPASQVVVKISKAQDEHKEFFEDTIFNEAERLRRLDHRGIVRILPVQTDNRMRAQAYSARASALPGNPWFLVLEYLTGDSLATLLQNYKQLDVPLTLEVVRKIAQTLEYLHYNDLVHLDIKPENILFRRQVEVGGRIEPVLIDFGIARNTGQAGLEGRTLHYAPPERILHNRGNAPPETLPRPSPSMDIYSLGVVFYQMLAGRRPFEGRTPRSISSAILEGKPTHPSKYSPLIWPALDEIVMQMLDRDPNRRPTAGELVQRLAELRSQPLQPASAPAAARPLQIGAPRQRNLLALAGKALALVGVLLLVLIVGSTVLDYRQSGQWRLPTATTLQAAPLAVSRYIQTLAGDLLPTAEPGPPPTESSPTTVDATDPANPGMVTPAPALTVTATAQVVAQITPLATPTSAPTTTPQPPTSTPMPTHTATATPLPSPTPQPTWTPSSTPTQRPPTSTPAPEITAPPVVVEAPTVYTPIPDKTQAPPTPRPVNRAVTLLEPADGAQGNDRVRFTWQSSFQLGPGEAYEFITWLRNQDPMRDGRGWAGTTTNLFVEINLLDHVDPEAYHWGVLLVKTNPYTRIQYLGGGWTYFLKSR